MADSKVVKELDSKLMEQGVISKEYSRDYKIVHKMLNSYMKRTGKILTQKNFDRGNEKLRDYLVPVYRSFQLL
jgi:hypothetical protein